MSRLELALLLDGLSLVICIAVLTRFGRLRHSHPATIYLFFHIYSFTFRLVSIWAGAPTLFQTWGPQFLPVTHAEIVKATFMADAALLAMTAAWIRASLLDYRTVNSFGGLDREPSLSLGHILRVVRISLPVGLVGLVTLSRIPGIENTGSIYPGAWQQSSWFTITQAWAGLSLLALIYWYGFRWKLIIPMLLYLVVISFQGYHRYRTMIPIILLVQVYLDRRDLKWPTFRVSLILLALAVLFFPLKSIGRMVQEGASATDLVTSSVSTIRVAISGEAPDQLFLDQYASAVSLIDDAGVVYFGRTYLPLLTLPIPRQLWAGKPGLGDYYDDFSKPWRPMNDLGMIMTFLGESYANFRYFGVVLVPYFLAYCLGRAYFYAYRRNFSSIQRFAYLLVACNIIQVYRDGIISIVVFTMVNMMPLTIIVILHLLAPYTTHDQDLEHEHYHYLQSRMLHNNQPEELHNG